FFGAGRFTKPEENRTLAITGINYATSTDEKRWEGKVTYALNSGNNVKVGYTKRTTNVKNNRFGTIMDLASLYDNSTDQHLYTEKLGAHSFVTGFDNFKEWRKNDNWQSGSQYNISASSTIIDGAAIYPVFLNDNTTFINYLPILQQSVGNDIRTYSAYVNDGWRYSSRISFTLGA